MTFNIILSDLISGTVILQGIKEVTLLGQNVNSYRDLSEYSSKEENPKTPTSLAKGRTTATSLSQLFI